ncbi:MAG: hypothetical protein PVI75_01255 [Gammaproteobacteria bacterium]|jgi:adenosylhomocysteinase
MSKTLYNAYSKDIPEKDRQCIKQLSKQWGKPKPFCGKKVLLNCHITLSTLIIIDTLIRGGAKVEVTATDDLVVHKNVLEIMEEAKIKFYPKGRIPKDKIDGFYYMAFDCGAGLLGKVTTKKGMVELTQTDPNLYKNIKFPVITVDNSKTKKLETSLGTGDGAIRALIFHSYNTLQKWINFVEFARKTSRLNQGFVDVFNVAMLMHSNLFFNRKYMLFGFGKVGSGIAAALVSAGVKESDIYVIDINEKARQHAKNKKHTVFDLNEKTLPKLKKILKNDIHCVLTATGVEGVISKYFKLKDFSSKCILANMGTPDEFGKNFKKEDVLNNKKILNFMLPFPTEVVFLEAIFTIFLKAGVQLLTDKNLKNGLQNVDNEIDNEVLFLWKKYNDEAKWPHKEFMKHYNEKLRKKYIALKQTLKLPHTKKFKFFSLHEHNKLSKIQNLNVYKQIKSGSIGELKIF